MNNLYNEIYKAINEGVIKSLKIDDDNEQQSNVEYKRSEIKNDFYLPILNKAIKKLGHLRNIKDNYATIEKYSNFLDMADLYEISDLIELSKIVRSLKRNIDTDNLNLKWIDTSNAVTFVLHNGMEVPMHLITNNDVELIKFHGICEHPIIIHKNLFIQFDRGSNVKWCTKEICDQYENSKNSKLTNLFKKEFKHGKGYYTERQQHEDIYGWENTYRNPNIWDGKKNDFTGYQIFEMIQQIDEEVSNFLPNYQAYLPAMGEINAMIKNYDIIDIITYIFNIVNGTNRQYIFSSTGESYASHKGSNVVSSSEMDETFVWYLKNGCTSYGHWKYENGGYDIMPLFKEIKR